MAAVAGELWVVQVAFDGYFFLYIYTLLSRLYDVKTLRYFFFSTRTLFTRLRICLSLVRVCFETRVFKHRVCAHLEYKYVIVVVVVLTLKTHMLYIDK